MAQALLDHAENNYEQGLALLTNLLDTEINVIEARNNFNIAISQYKPVEILLLKAKGELKILKNNKNDEKGDNLVIVMALALIIGYTFLL